MRNFPGDEDEETDEESVEGLLERETRFSVGLEDITVGEEVWAPVEKAFTFSLSGCSMTNG